MATIDVYTFEDKNGQDSGSFWTQDLEEARKYAQDGGLKIIVNEYEFSDSYALDGEDYTPRTSFEFHNEGGEDITGDADQEEEAWQVRASDEGTLTAEVRKDEAGAWFTWSSPSLSTNSYPAWRDAMKALDVTDFRELDD